MLYGGSERKCFIHVGTHKTGTTSIQHLLSRNSSALQERGYFYPQAGRLESSSGHHNLAWEISGDHRFRDNYGSIDDLIKEVKSRSDHIILSSEDFGWSLYNKSNFSDFILLLQSSGFLVTFILYVRNQIDYLPRAYLTSLDCGGNLSWREWTFLNVDYCDLLRRFRESANVDIIVRSYDQARTSICRDFLSIFNLTLRDLHVEDEVWENVSRPLRDYLRIFLQNRMSRNLDENEETTINRLVSPEAKKIRLSPALRVDLFHRFRDTNRNLFIQYGIPEPKMDNTPGVQDSPETPYVDELFSEAIESHLLKPQRQTAARQDGFGTLHSNSHGENT